jgi:hypothetical protein
MIAFAATRWAFALATLLAATVSYAGAIVCFTPGNGKSCAEPVLQNVPFKAAVTEFLDPNQTTIGHSVSRLLWREVLESVYDLKGAGVILAYEDHERDQLRHMLEGRDYRDVLQHDYHNAAVRIAQELKTQMTVWGAVLENDGNVHVEAYLTLLPHEDDAWNRLRLSLPGNEAAPLSAAIGRLRLNFGALTTDRATLFRHDWLTRCRMANQCPGGIEIRRDPSNSGQIIGHVAPGAIVTGRDMHDQWVEIESPGGGTAYINVYHVEILAPAVHVLDRSIRLHAEPDAHSNLLPVSAMAGETYATRSARRGQGDVLWYQIEVAGALGWVPPDAIQRDYNFPVVHFIAGIYRYGLHDYSRAVEEFQRFVERGRGREDNVTLAAAYQYLAASKVAAAGTNGVAGARAAAADAEEAIQQTPYDPDAYAFSSLIRLGALDSDGALADLAKSLECDSASPAAHSLLSAFSTVVDSHPGGLGASSADTLRLRARVRELLGRVGPAGGV